MGWGGGRVFYLWELSQRISWIYVFKYLPVALSDLTWVNRRLCNIIVPIL